MGRNLKNFNKYMDKLQAYAEACDITIEYSPGTEGEFIPSKRKIKLDPDEEESTIVAVFLHEAAHFLDDSVSDSNTQLDKAYKACYKDRASDHQMELVLECEQRAWDYGRGIAKKLRIPLGAWYDAEEQECINSYRDVNDQETREE